MTMHLFMHKRGGININPSDKTHKASICLNGANMEDLTFHCYGEIYS